jgi:hypothetical protein
MLEHLEPTHHRRFSLMGQTVECSTNSLEISLAAEEAFSGFPPAEEKNYAPLQIGLYVQPDGGFKSDQDYGNAPTKPFVQTMDHLLLISLGKYNIAAADMRSGQAFGVLTPDMARRRSVVRHVFIEALGQAMLGLARGYIALHAACVAKEGISVLLQARPGTGKSTLAYACARRGYQVVAEDVVQVDLGATPPRLWGFPWRIHLLPDATRFFPELEGVRPMEQINGERKMVVRLTEAFPDAPLTHANPKLLVFLRRGTEREQPPFRWLSPEEARRELELIWSWTTGWTPSLESKADQLTSQGAYTYCMTGTPDDAVDDLDSLLLEYREG